MGFRAGIEVDLGVAVEGVAFDELGVALDELGVVFVTVGVDFECDVGGVTVGRLDNLRETVLGDTGDSKSGNEGVKN